MIPGLDDRAMELNDLLHRAGYDWRGSHLYLDGEQWYPASHCFAYCEGGGTTAERVVKGYNALFQFERGLRALRALIGLPQERHVV